MQVGFVTTPDHVRIACSSQGDGPPLVFVRGWFSHLELLWDDPLFRAYFEALAQHFTVARFDMRGDGLSDHHVPKIDLAGMVIDLQTVITSLGDQKVVLYGQCFGGPAAIAYTAAHPERVERLILDGTYADGRTIAPPERQKRILGTLRDLPEAGLAFMSNMSHPNPAPTKFRSSYLRDGWLYKENALQLYKLGFRVNVTALLPRIHTPTLVLHRTGTRAIPFRLGRALASSINGARFVALEGQAHNAWDEHPRVALDAVGEFLGVRFTYETTAGPPLARQAGALTILFTDMEASTPMTQRLGDARAQTLVREHNAIVREALGNHLGDEIKHTGDGIMASFESPSHAIECAISIQRAMAVRSDDASPLRVRIGLNAGEPVVEEQDLFGTAVQLAKRVCDAGNPCDILVTNVVRELCAGKGFLFSDRGIADLKGFDEPVRLYEVLWRSDP